MLFCIHIEIFMHRYSFMCYKHIANIVTHGADLSVTSINKYMAQDSKTTYGPW